MDFRNDSNITSNTMEALRFFIRELEQIDAQIVCAKNRNYTELVEFYEKNKMAYIEAKNALIEKIKNSRSGLSW